MITILDLDRSSRFHYVKHALPLAPIERVISPCSQCPKRNMRICSAGFVSSTISGRSSSHEQSLQIAIAPAEYRVLYACTYVGWWDEKPRASG